METTRSIFREGNDGQVHAVLGMRHVYKATATETNGTYVSFTIEIPPGCQAPPHCHAIDSESFYVLDGTITFTDPTGTRVARPGDFVYLPPGSAHAFVNDGAEPARALVIAAPGIEAERFFAEVDAAFGDGPPDVAALTAMAARHGLEILPPADPSSPTP